MKKFVAFMIFFVVNGCAFNMSKALENETEESIRAFAVIGKTTYCDVLRKMKKPSYKFVRNNGEYGYFYYTASHNMSGLLNPFSKATVTKTKQRNVVFTFRDKVLTRIDFDVKANDITYKYKYVDLPLEPEFNLYNASDAEFMNKIKIGMKKGAIFRLIGRPTMAIEEEGGKESWMFNVFKRVHTDGEDWDPTGIVKTVNLLKSKLVVYSLIFDNDTVIERYTSGIDALPRGYSTDLTEEEAQCIK